MTSVKLGDIAPALAGVRVVVKANDRARRKAATAVPRLNAEERNALAIVDSRPEIAHEVLDRAKRRKLVMFGLIVERSGRLSLTAAGEVAVQEIEVRQVKVRRVIK